MRYIMNEQEKSHLSVAPSPDETGCRQFQPEPEKSTEHQLTQSNHTTMDSKERHAEPLPIDQGISSNKGIPKKIVLSNKLSFEHAGIMLNKPLAPQWVVEGFFEKKSLNSIFGDSGAGKSFVTVDLSCAVALGIKWHGYKTMHGGVLYIAGEGTQGYASRCQAWAEYHKVNLTDALLWFSDNAVNLSKPESIKQVSEVVDQINNDAKQPVRLIIIDTLARSMDGDENNGQDMGELIQKLDYLKDKYQCAIVLVHHTGHQDKHRARGSTVIKGALDAEFRVSQGKENIIQFECTKMKEAEAPESLAFKLHDVELPIQHEGRPVYKAIVVQVENPVTDEQGSSSVRHLGKNQQLGLWALRELIKEQAGLSLDTQDNTHWVKVDAWRAKLIDAKLPKPRFYEVRKGLIDGGHIAISEDGQLVKLLI